MNDFQENCAWIRSDENPVIRPEEGGPFGEGVCMNPQVVPFGGTNYIFYASIKPDGGRTIFLCTAPSDRPLETTPRGPILENGPEGSFDHAWCVLPCVVSAGGGLWYLYYTGNRGFGEGLSRFAGIGLAVSRDLIHWRKYGDGPVFRPADFGSIGMASVSAVREPGGGGFRLYFTTFPTCGSNVFLDQQKRLCYAVSGDGLSWTYKGIIMERDPGREYENIAVTGGCVLYEDGLWRMWYNAIGTRWGFYSICYAESEDGCSWYRGSVPFDNMHIGPAGLRRLDCSCEDPSWECQMTEYPSVIRENGHLRMFYSGNSYGRTGIGTAVSAALRAAPAGDPAGGAVRIWSFAERGASAGRLLNEVSADCSPLSVSGCWTGGDHNGDFWIEEELSLDGAAPALRCRVVAIHRQDLISLECAVENRSGSALRGISVSAALGSGAPARVFWENSDGSGFAVPELPAGATVNVHGGISPE